MMTELTPLQKWQRNADRVLYPTGEPRTLSDCEYKSYERKPRFYDPGKLKRLTAEQARRLTTENGAGVPAIATGAHRIYAGERGGRYYKRTRADGTTYRQYTF